MNKTPFKDFDVASFWDNNEYAQKYYIGTTPTDEQVKDIENELGYKLPQSYIALIKPVSYTHLDVYKRQAI